VAIEHPEMEDTIRIYVKGAPETILKNCTETYDENGDKIELDAEHGKEIKKLMRE
jgi:magnesium-transporting ATPase (P-type)